MNNKLLLDPHEFALAVLSTQNLNYADNEAGHKKIVDESYAIYMAALEKAIEHNSKSKS